MEPEKKIDDTATGETVVPATTSGDTETVLPEATVEVAPEASVATESEEATVPATTSGEAATHASLLTKQSMWYVLAFVVVLVMGLSLWFVMERDGRVHTNVFGSIVTMIKGVPAAAIVNGVEIPMTDVDGTVKQLSANTAAQGLDPNDPTVLSELRAQAIESLVNTEILRQEALKNNISVTDEQVEEKYQSIAKGIGGEEKLKARMEELSVSEEMLRRDIFNDILIQAHIEKAVDLSGVEVTDTEIAQLYDQASEAGNDLPPLAEVRPQIEQQLRFQKEQELVGKYVDGLRQGAQVEILI